MKVNISNVGKSKVIALLINQQLEKQNKKKVGFMIIQSKLKRSRIIGTINGVVLNTNFSTNIIDCSYYDRAYGQGEALKALSSIKLTIN